MIFANRPSRVLIAGCGYVGTALAERLARGGDEVVGVRRSGGPGLSFPGGGAVRMVAASFGDLDALTRTCDGVEHAVFAAAADATNDAAYQATYVEGLRAVMGALVAARAPVRRLVFTSSTGVYGQSQGERVDESSPTLPNGFAGRRMLEAESVAASAPFSAVSLRLGGIYGPGRARMIEAVRRGEARLSPGRGAVTNRIHRDDAAGALAHLLAMEAVLPVYLGVDSEPASRNDVLRYLAAALGLREPPREDSAPLRERTGDKRCDNARLLASGYVLAHPTFREGYGALLAEGEGAPREDAGVAG